MEYYLLEDLAAKLKLSERLLKSFIKSGILGAVKLGAHWIISEQDLDQFYQSLKNAKQPIITDNSLDFCQDPASEVVQPKQTAKAPKSATPKKPGKNLTAIFEDCLSQIPEEIGVVDKDSKKTYWIKSPECLPAVAAALAPVFALEGTVSELTVEDLQEAGHFNLGRKLHLYLSESQAYNTKSAKRWSDTHQAYLQEFAKTLQAVNN